jgi:hypothetical protein
MILSNVREIITHQSEGEHGVHKRTYYDDSEVEQVDQEA